MIYLQLIKAEFEMTMNLSEICGNPAADKRQIWRKNLNLRCHGNRQRMNNYITCILGMMGRTRLNEYGW